MSHKMNLGGTEKALLSFINALKDKEVKITLLLLEDGGVLRDEIPSWVHVEILNVFESIKLVIFDSPLVLTKTQLNQRQFCNAINTILRYVKVKLTKSWYYNYIFALKGYKSNYKADVAIAFAGPSDFISYFILKHISAPTKYQWIHFDVRQVLLNTNFGNKYYTAFDRIFCVSENAKFVFDEMFPQYRCKSTVFKNIVSKKELESLAMKGETFTDNYSGLRIVTLGRLSKEKGQDMIPEVVSHLIKSGLDFRWYIIGEGYLRKQIEDQINELQIHQYLVLLDAQLNPYRYLKDSDLYVQTSLHEGYCLTIHEAKMFDKAVVTTSVASATNLIVNNEDGLIVPISVEGLYEGVKRMLLDTELRNKCSKALLAVDTTAEIHKIFEKEQMDKSY